MVLSDTDFNVLATTYLSITVDLKDFAKDSQKWINVNTRSRFGYSYMDDALLTFSISLQHDLSPNCISALT